MNHKLAGMVLCISCATATAADNGVYLGVGVGSSKYDIGGALDKSDVGYKFVGGVRLLDSFAIEATVADLGKAQLPSGVACAAVIGVNCPGVANVNTKAVSAFALAFADFPLLDLFAKVGVAYLDTKVRVPNISSFNVSDAKTNLAWGAGVQAHFTSLGLRAEFEQFKLAGDRKLGLISVSAIYTFL
jgi:opacity protein-like surface antigen